MWERLGTVKMSRCEIFLSNFVSDKFDAAKYTFRFVLLKMKGHTSIFIISVVEILVTKANKI